MGTHITTGFTGAANYFILDVNHNFYLIISDIYQEIKRLGDGSCNPLYGSVT